MPNSPKPKYHSKVGSSLSDNNFEENTNAEAVTEKISEEPNYQKMPSKLSHSPIQKYFFTSEEQNNSPKYKQSETGIFDYMNKSNQDLNSIPCLKRNKSKQITQSMIFSDSSSEQIMVFKPFNTIMKFQSDRITNNIEIDIANIVIGIIRIVSQNDMLESHNFQLKQENKNDQQQQIKQNYEIIQLKEMDIPFKNDQQKDKNYKHNKIRKNQNDQINQEQSIYDQEIKNYTVHNNIQQIEYERDIERKQFHYYQENEYKERETIPREKERILIEQDIINQIEQLKIQLIKQERINLIEQQKREMVDQYEMEQKEEQIGIEKSIINEREKNEIIILEALQKDEEVKHYEIELNDRIKGEYQIGNEIKKLDQEACNEKLDIFIRKDKQLEIDQEQENLKINPSKFIIENIQMKLPQETNPIVFDPSILEQTPLLRQGGHIDFNVAQLAKNYTINECKYAISAHMSSISSFAFHPHLMLLLSGSLDGSVSLTDVSHSAKKTLLNEKIKANPLPNLSMTVVNITPYVQAAVQQAIPLKMLDPKWHFVNSQTIPILKRIQINNIQKEQQMNNEIVNEQFNQQQQQQEIQRNTISYNPILCVIFLPYLESNNDRKRKQYLNNIEQFQNPIIQKMSQDLGCFAAGSSDGRISVYGLPDPNMQMIDNNNKLQPNKMFEIIGHKDAVWSIDETQQQFGLYNGVGIPHKGQVINETRLVSGSADGTVRVWKIRSDGTIPTTAQTSGNNDVDYNSFYQQERIFKHTPSISNSVVTTWNNARNKIINYENLNYDKNKIQFLSEREVIEDKWQESDIPSSVLFDPMNMDKVITGYVSGDIVRFDIETNQESGYTRIGSQNKAERILTISKSRYAPHYSRGLMVPLLVTTNLGYLHLVEPTTLHTIASIKAPNDQINTKSIGNDIQIKTIQSLSSQLQKKSVDHTNVIQLNRIIMNNYPIYSQQVYYSSLNDRIERLKRRNEQFESSSLTNQQIIEPSPLEMWKYGISTQLTVKTIFTNATYLQSDSLIAASTNTGHVIMYDIRHNGQIVLGRIGQVNNINNNICNLNSPSNCQRITSMAAHSQHNLLVTGNEDGFINIFCGNSV